MSQRTPTQLYTLFTWLVLPTLALANATSELGQAHQAFMADDYQRARPLAEKIAPKRLQNDDYRLYFVAQSRFATGDFRGARRAFLALSRQRGSRFSALASWRIADCSWLLNQRESATKRYRHLLAKLKSPLAAKIDLGLVRYRLAETTVGPRQKAAYLVFLRRHPLHPLAPAAESALRGLGSELSAEDRLARAKVMKANKNWTEALQELAKIPAISSETIKTQRDYWTAMTLFRMRRQYQRAGETLLGLHEHMGRKAAFAMFHGARALSRANFDRQAIKEYRRVAQKYPRSPWAAKALFLAGWLDFNLGNYRAGIPDLKRTIRLYGSSRSARSARWYLGFSHFLLREYRQALPYFKWVAKQPGRLQGGKGQYWSARTKELLGKAAVATDEYRKLVSRYPFSWYALLAHSRLQTHGIKIGPFGPTLARSSKGLQVVAKLDENLAHDKLIKGVDELLSAGLHDHASQELRRGERNFLRRHPRAKGLAMLLNRYRKAGNFNRPWQLSVAYNSAQVFNRPALGHVVRIWWKHAYPQAYRELIEKHRKLANNPTYWLYAIMRKESGFNPHVHSYADARGLLQMIPATTKRVGQVLGIAYTEDLLFEPEKNIQTGSWYIGRLFHKFRGQIPMAAGSFNSGPRPVMRWFDKFGQAPADVWVERVSYTTTREYMKKVTETYARYLYLYDNEIYEQPLSVIPHYAQDTLVY